LVPGEEYSLHSTINYLDDEHVGTDVHDFAPASIPFFVASTISTILASDNAQFVSDATRMKEQHQVCHWSSVAKFEVALGYGQQLFVGSSSVIVPSSQISIRFLEIRDVNDSTATVAYFRNEYYLLYPTK
jgi:hypothetical protein